MAPTPIPPPICEYFNVKQDAYGHEYMEVYLDGIALLRLTMTNKGTAYSAEERIGLRLDGLLPPHVSTIEEQLDRVYRGFRREPSPLAQYQFLRSLQDRNEILFYALLEKHLHEMLPIVYTPTVGEAVQQFHLMYQTPRGASFSPLNIDRARKVIKNFVWEDVRMIVATDSSAILGIGDQGYGGLAIPIGKLSLYTVGGGVSPYQTMPVALDIGTDRADLIEDAFYLGVRQRRLKGPAYFEFMDQFVDAVRSRYPHAVIQWEDLSKEAAFAVLERYRKVLPSFNDDIQGTGAVALAGVVSACKMTGEALRDQRIVILGAGAGGGGVAWAIWRGLRSEGLTAEEAYARIFVLDSKGLLTTDRPMEDYKKPFAHDPARLRDHQWKIAGKYPTLLETIQGARATVLLGLSGQPGSFDEAMVRAMLPHTPRPIVFPLSNPTSSCECTPDEIVRWSDGRAIVATGSPFPPVQYQGKTFEVGQGNNAFIFPGLGHGAILAEAREVTDNMVMAAGIALSDYTAEKYLASGLIYPPVDDLQEVSVRVAARVIAQAQADGVAANPSLEGEKDLEAFVRARFWRPRYLRMVKGG